jgi:cytosine/adenosine deaminase-related metal-dependent hydrolase
VTQRLPDKKECKVKSFNAYMTYRKFKADYLFTGQEMANGDAVLITSGDGTVQTIIPASEAGGDIEHLSGILSPGFINCHCHLELSHMKGLIPERTGLIDFLLTVIKGRAATGNIQSAIAAAEEEMLHNGIVAVGDICNTTDTLAQKSAGNLYYHNFIEAMGFMEQTAPDRYENSLRIYEAFAKAYILPIETNSLVPHAPYSVSHKLFEMIANFPGNHLLSIHNQESEAENEFYRTGKGDFLRLYEAMGLDTSFFSGSGKRSLESWLPYFHPNQSLILVHNLATSGEDLRFALNWKGGAGNRQRDAGNRRGGPAELFFCLCPNANLYISGLLPDPELLLRNNCAIVVGTDSLASNHQLCILEELKTLQRQFPGIATATLLQWATLNGARALQLDGVLGSFAPGKQPGVVLIAHTEGERIGTKARVKRMV